MCAITLHPRKLLAKFQKFLTNVKHMLLVNDVCQMKITSIKMLIEYPNRAFREAIMKFTLKGN